MRRTLTMLFVLFIITCVPAWSGPKAVLFVVNSTTLDDFVLPYLPHFKQAINDGSVGLMNARTAGNPPREQSTTGLEAGCLTIGAGTRAIGGYKVRRAYKAGDQLHYLTAADVWAARMLHPKPDAEILQPSIAGIIADNARKKHYSVTIGGLGGTLHSAGLKTAVIGNSDTRGELHRESVGITMDQDGLVDFGEVGSRLNKLDPAAPFGLTSNREAYVKALDRIWPEADLIVVDAGDTLRASIYTASCVPAQSEHFHRQAMLNADWLLGELMRRTDPRRDLLITLCPNLSPDSVDDGKLLAPVVVNGPGYGRGLLESASTRRAGIMTNADIAPTVLQFFGLTAPESMVGRPVFSLAADSAIDRLVSMERRIMFRSRQQPLSRWTATISAVIIFLVTAALLLPRRRVRVPAWIILLPASIILSALYMPLLGIWDLWLSAIVLIVLSTAASVLFPIILRGSMKVLAFISIALSVGLVVDILLGARLLKESVLSYSAVEGARYYGLGNEYMGALIGAVIIGLGLVFWRVKLPVRIRQMISIPALMIVAVAIGAPALGANTGGTMSIIPASLVALKLRTGQKIKTAHVIGICCAIIAGVLALIFADSMGGDGQSHIGRFGGSVSSGGVQQLIMVFQRKLAMNFTLLASSLWSRLMLIAASAILLLWALPRTGVGQTIRGSVELYAAIIASIVGAASAFIFNDSGVVAAAICLIYPWSAVALLALQVKENSEEVGK